MPARTASNPSLPEPGPPRPTRRLPYLLAPLLLLLSLCAQAATYHVAPTGDDADPGDAASPWASIGHAADPVAAGDTVVVAAGTYPELVSVMASGTAAAPIRFEAAGAVTMERFRLLGDYVQVAGFKVRTLDCGDGDSYGIEARGAGFVMEGNDIYAESRRVSRALGVARRPPPALERRGDQSVGSRAPCAERARRARSGASAGSRWR